MLAGVNGAGKSSVVGASVRAKGGDYYNPDEAAKSICAVNPGMSPAEANGAAWRVGTRLLQRATSEGRDFTIETTLGGNTITRLLKVAMDAGVDVHGVYVGLQSPELHIARVRARVALGGHDIPAQKIRKRYDTSRQHLIEILPRLASLDVYDNSVETPPEQEPPLLVPVLRMEDGVIVEMQAPTSVPEWAKPIVMAAIKIQRDFAEQQDDPPRHSR